MAMPAFLTPEIVPYACVEIVRVNGHVDRQPLVVVCAWHVSVAELMAISRQFPGQVSHALCPACAVRFEGMVR